MLYDALRGLPLTIERVETETLAQPISPEFTRNTTVIHLHGGGAEGIGEDVTYDPRQHAEAFPVLDLAGDWTIESLSAHLDGIDQFPGGEPDQRAYRDYRRWAFESAALDLALRLAGLSLGGAIAREHRPVRFAASPRTTSLSDWLAIYPDLRFKQDATPEWTDEVVAELAGRGIVDVVDLKGQYHGTVVDNPADAELYRRVAEGFPDTWIEDPALTPETDGVLEPFRDRVTWDAPIHSWADVEALPFAPRCLNVKPSRFGSLERLLEFYDRCEEEGIELYGGGQFELGPGRGQIQLLASLFSADGPNDVAPGGYNGDPRPGLETSPLDPRPEPTGFRRGSSATLFSMRTVGTAALGALALAAVLATALVPAGAAASAKNACTLVTRADASKALRTKVAPGTHQKVGPLSTCIYKHRFLELKVSTRPLSRKGFSKAVFALRGLEFGAAEISPIARASYLGDSLTVIAWKKGTELIVRVTGAKDYSMIVVESVAKPALRKL